MIKQEILDAFNFRHACKSFNAEKKISDEDFQFIMETARLSPSTFGSEPWHFLVVQDMEKRKTLSGSFWVAMVNGKQQVIQFSFLQEKKKI